MAGADPRGGHSIGEIAGGLASDVQDLVRGELALARAELEQKLHGGVIAAISILGGALVAFAGLAVVLEGGAAVLAFWCRPGASLLIVGVAIVVIGGLIRRAGLAKLSLKAVSRAWRWKARCRYSTSSRTPIGRIGAIRHLCDHFCPSLASATAAHNAESVGYSCAPISAGA